MSLQYSEIEKQYAEVMAQQQELDSATYGLKPVTINKEQYNFCCYFDKEEKEMRAVVLDSQFSQVHLAGHLSIELYIQFGAFCLEIKDWQEGKAPFMPSVPSDKQMEALRNATLNSIAVKNEEAPVYGETADFDLSEEINQAKELIKTVRG